MGLYVEVMCDVRRQGVDPKSLTLPFCWSNRNDNPQGPNVAAARQEARNSGWLVRGAKTVCPNCRTAKDPDHG